MNTETATKTETADLRLGRFLSVTGVVHATKGCATRGRNKGALIDAEDIAYFTERGIEHKFCERCAS